MHTVSRIMRIIAYTCGAAALAAFTHRFNTEAATGVALTAAVVAALLGFLPRMIVNLQRAELARLVDERFEQLRETLNEDITVALRHALELGVQDGALRRSLDRAVGEPPRPGRRLHSVPRNREGA